MRIKEPIVREYPAMSQESWPGEERLKEAPMTCRIAMVWPRPAWAVNCARMMVVMKRISRGRGRVSAMLGLRVRLLGEASSMGKCLGLLGREGVVEEASQMESAGFSAIGGDSGSLVSIDIASWRTCRQR